MIGWVVRILLLAAGAVAALFVAPDADNFSVVQGMVAVAIFAAAVLVVAVLVTEVQRGSPADRGGVERGDLLVSAGGEPMRGVGSLLRWLSGERVGEPAELVLLRRGDLRRVKVVPEERAATSG